MIDRITSARQGSYHLAGPDGLEWLEPRVLFNAAPYAEPDNVTIPINAGEVEIDVTVNDTDADGDPIAASAILLQPGAGSARVENGLVYYTAPTGFAGDDPFIVQVSDPSGATDGATVFITVEGQPGNTPPFAEQDDLTVVNNNGAPILLDVLANDTDADDDTISIVGLTPPVFGDAVIDNGQVRYTPLQGFVGIDYFTYNIGDGSGATDLAFVVLDVQAGAGVNTRPFAGQDAFDVPNDGSPVTLDVLANDTDDDGDPLSVEAVTPAQFGAVELVGGDVFYTPPAGFSGQDYFVYTLADGRGGTDIAYAVIQVTPGAANVNPFANPDDVTVTTGTVDFEIDVTINDTDADGDLLSASAIVLQPGAGSARVENGLVYYTAPVGLTGGDPFIVQITDGRGGFDTANVNITLEPPPNAAPDAVDDTATVQQDGGPFTLTVLSNDSDPEGDPLTITGVTQGVHGSASTDGVTVSYTPGPGYAGPDSFTYTVTDGEGNFDTATVGVTVEPTPNVAPTAVDDAAQTEQDSTPLVVDVLANDTDDDNDPLTVTAVTQGANGSVSTDGSTVTYTPAAGFSGSDTFTYTITDGQGNFDTADVEVTVTPVNRGTIQLNTDAYTIDEDGVSVVVTIDRVGGADGVVDADFTTVEGSATAGDDYVATSGTVVFEDGQTTATVTLLINDDNDDEGDETFTFSLDRVGGGAALGAPRTALITVVDDDDPPAPGNGLLGEYFDDRNLTDLVLRRTDTTVDFDWDNGSPAPQVGGNTFSVRWTGQIRPEFSETYTFRTVTDDGVRLWVDGQLIIDEWINQSATSHTGVVTLTAGQLVDLKMEMYENQGDAVAELYWSSPSVADSIIPTVVLFSPDPEPVNNPAQLSGETVVSGLTQPTAIDFAADGTMFIAQKNGVVRVAQNDQLLAAPFIDISDIVNDTRDRGLLGLAVHPDFPNTPYVYLLYTYDPPETQGQSGLAAPDQNGNRAGQLLRVTADASTGYTTALPGSEEVILGRNSTWDNISSPDQDSTGDFTIPPSGFDENGDPIDDFIASDSQSHTVGSLDFGVDGMLYVSIGDGTSYGNVDWRTLRVQDVNNLSGKLLRIDPITGDGLTDNPYYDGDVTANRAKVYSYGLRNPFRIAVNPTTGVPYIGDVGWGAWEEINAATTGGENFGWPYYEGGNGQNLRTGGYRDLPEAQAFYASNPDAEPPLWSRSHSDGGRAIVLGDFMAGSTYAGYEDALFFTDYGDPVIKALLFLPDGTPDRVVTAAPSVGVVVEMTMGVDGLMYYVDLVGGKVGRFTLP